MASIATSFGKKAAKATARHTWRGVVSKAERKPLRSATLLTAGVTVGLIAGWMVGRATARRAGELPRPPAPPGPAPPSQTEAFGSQPAEPAQPGPHS